jgi:hypothetical protein
MLILNLWLLGFLESQNQIVQSLPFLLIILVPYLHLILFTYKLVFLVLLHNMDSYDVNIEGIQK